MSAAPRPSSPGGAGRRLAAAAALAALAACAAAALAAPPAGEAAQRPVQKRAALTVACSSWVLPNRPLAVVLEQNGVLAGRQLNVDLFVDANQLQRVATTGGRTASRLELPELAPGVHVLTARSARESARAEFRVVPWSWLAGALGAAVAVVVALVAVLRRRRAPTGG